MPRRRVNQLRGKIFAKVVKVLGKCSVKACPFPPTYTGQCRHHQTMFDPEESKLIAGMGSYETFEKPID